MMNEIRFDDAVETDTIADMLSLAAGWTVTLGLDGHEVTGTLIDAGVDGIQLKGHSFGSSTHRWTDIQFVTIH